MEVALVVVEDETDEAAVAALVCSPWAAAAVLVRSPASERSLRGEC